MNETFKNYLCVSNGHESTVTLKNMIIEPISAQRIMQINLFLSNITIFEHINTL